MYGTVRTTKYIFKMHNDVYKPANKYSPLI